MTVPDPSPERETVDPDAGLWPNWHPYGASVVRYGPEPQPDIPWPWLAQPRKQAS